MDALKSFVLIILICVTFVDCSAKKKNRPTTPQPSPPLAPQIKSLAIDFGNEWLKVCVINNHAQVLLEMAINEQSNRKTPSIMGFGNDGDIEFGEAALSLAFRNPSEAYPHLKRLIGKGIDSSQIQSYRNDFPGFHNFIRSDKNPEKQFFFERPAPHPPVCVEELLAMFFQWMKRMAESHTKTYHDTVPLNESVLVVPDYFHAYERRLFVQLAELAGLKVKATLKELTAVAIDYGTRNVLAGSKKVIIYGIGAHTVSAALFKINRSDAGLQVEELIASSTDAIGGANWDVVLRDELAKLFDQQMKKKNKQLKSISSSKRALAKLLREARELKEQLSASPSVQIHMEELFEGNDFEADISRTQFESFTESLILQVLQPLKSVITESIRTSLIGLNEAIVVELYGGGVRIPSVQQALTDYFQTLSTPPLSLSLSLGKHVDGDEAAVFGAAHYAAVLSGINITSVSILHPTPKEEEGESGGMSDDEKEVVRKILAERDMKALQKHLSQDAKNQLESYIFETRERVSNLKVKESIRTELNRAIDEASQFLDDNSFDLLPADAYKQRYQLLKDTLQLLLKKSTKTEL